MSVFVDTSAFLAVLDADDLEHGRGKAAWERILAEEDVITCSSYVLVETFALVRRRLGIEAVRALHEEIYPTLTITWVDEADHRAGVAAILVAARRQLSLVDCVSFEVIRRLGIDRVFCFDQHFAEQGFQCLPGEDNETTMSRANTEPAPP